MIARLAPIAVLSASCMNVLRDAYQNQGKHPVPKSQKESVLFHAKSRSNLSIVHLADLDGVEKMRDT